MAAGLTDHVWNVKQLLTTVLVPLATNTYQGDLQASNFLRTQKIVIEENNKGIYVYANISPI